jgi:hypothetical protein
MNLNLFGGHSLPLYLLLSGHICADYLCQSKRFVVLKRKRERYLLFHLFLVWAFTVLFFLPYRSGKTLTVITALALSHYLIDRSKIRFRKARPETDQKALNILDQCLHFLLILLVWKIFFFNLPLPSFFSVHPRLLNYFAILIIILIGWKAVSNIFKKDETDVLM